MKLKRYNITGGIVDREDFVYVERPSDKKILEKLTSNENQYIVLRSNRQCGKSSLIYGIKNDLSKNKDVNVISFDLRRIPGLPKIQDKPRDTWWFESIFFHIYEVLIEDENNSEKSYSEYKNFINQERFKRLSLVGQFYSFISDYIRRLNQIKGKIILIFDELDQILSLGGYTDSFFVALNDMFNDRKLLNISFILITINPPPLLFKTANASEFRGKKWFELPDFKYSDEIGIQWGEGLNILDKDKLEIVKEIFKFTNGHPYLNVVILHELSQMHTISVKDVKKIVESKILFTNKIPEVKMHFEAPMDFITSSSKFAYRTIEVYENILQRPIKLSALDIEIHNVLKASGLIREAEIEVKGEKIKHFECRNKIYKHHFDKDWCKKAKNIVSSKSHRNYNYSLNKEDLPKICFLNAGGTIGMIEENNKMVPPRDIDQFISIYPMLDEVANITFIPLNVKDGANIYPEDWRQIAKAIYERINDGFKGFVVSHGTDTMVYTSSAVAFALGAGLNVPVVFVGSQAPHNVPHGDAYTNLLRACKIASLKIPEVVICFGSQVYRAVRAQKQNDYQFNGFHSPTYPSLAEITEKIEIKENLIRKYNPSLSMKFENNFNTNILVISQHPGLTPYNYRSLVNENNIQGVIIESLGIGNLPNMGETDIDKK